MPNYGDTSTSLGTSAPKPVTAPCGYILESVFGKMFPKPCPAVVQPQPPPQPSGTLSPPSVPASAQTAGQPPPKKGFFDGILDDPMKLLLIGGAGIGALLLIKKMR